MNNDEYLEAFGYWIADEVDVIFGDLSVSQMVKTYNETADNEKNEGLYASLIEEECGEFFKAFVNSHPDTEELKELADLVYVIYGYAWCRGWNLDEAVRRVHQNNMQRMYQDDGTIKRRSDGKVVKNPNAPKVTLDDLV